MVTYNGITFSQEEVDTYEEMSNKLDQFNRAFEKNDEASKPDYSDELVSKYRTYFGHKKVQELKDAGIYGIVRNSK